MPLILPEPLRARLMAAAQAAFPHEACGLLEGVRDGATVTVTALHPSANISPTPAEAFEIDPALHLAVQRRLRAAGTAEIVGCYHSHPDGRPEPSARDRACGCDDGWVWIIIATGVINAMAAFQAPAFTPLD